ncbi:MAG: hypothetical protein D6681_09790 [Calditrichaeota bacterium]|nr:MAG: hypothetical protein D6681_09790 [Calditrichota bacterium]
MALDNDWKKIGPFPGLLYAEMVGEVLKERGIPFYLSRQWFSLAYGAVAESPLHHSTFMFVPAAYHEVVANLVKGMFADDEMTPDEDSTE